MKEEHIWTKKPETMLDWFCVVGACIALYLTLNNLGYFLGKIGVFIGIVTFAIRYFGSMAEGVSYSILLGNLVTPYINDLTHQTPLGYVKPAKKAKEG